MIKHDHEHEQRQTDEITKTNTKRRERRDKDKQTKRQTGHYQDQGDGMAQHRDWIYELIEVPVELYVQSRQL